MSEHIYEDSDMENERYHVIPFGSMREEIVRCRDCKWCMAYHKATYCDMFAHELSGGTLDGFCAWGSRRDA